MPTELLIQGGHVVTVDPSLGDFVDGDVLVSDGLIAEVGHHLVASAPEAEVIDARGRLVIPGLVDTHRHVWQGAIGGFTPQMTGAGYELAVLRGIAPRHTPNDIYAGTLWGALQALDAGITTVGDWAHNLQSAEHADADLRGLQDSGIRGYFLYGGPGPASHDPDPPHPLDARRMRDEQFSAGTNGRLRMGMARCAWPWQRSAPGRTRPPWPEESGSRWSISTSATCCGSPPSTVPGCGLSTTRSGPSRRASRPTSPSWICAHRTSTGSATLSP